RLENCSADIDVVGQVIVDLEGMEWTNYSLVQNSSDQQLRSRI
ncbi:hypothetical protein L195_g062941, partial [Trifolium pratense]